MATIQQLCEAALPCRYSIITQRVQSALFFRRLTHVACFKDCFSRAIPHDLTIQRCKFDVLFLNSKCTPSLIQFREHHSVYITFELQCAISLQFEWETHMNTQTQSTSLFWNLQARFWSAIPRTPLRVHHFCNTDWYWLVSQTHIDTSIQKCPSTPLRVYYFCNVNIVLLLRYSNFANRLQSASLFRNLEAGFWSTIPRTPLRVHHFCNTNWHWLVSQTHMTHQFKNVCEHHSVYITSVMIILLCRVVTQILLTRSLCITV